QAAEGQNTGARGISAGGGSRPSAAALGRVRRGGFGPGGGSMVAAEPPLAGGVIAQGLVEQLRREVRPVDGGNPQLGVRDLPEQVVAHAHLAGRADQKVRV